MLNKSNTILRCVALLLLPSLIAAQTNSSAPSNDASPFSVLFHDYIERVKAAKKQPDAAAKTRSEADSRNDQLPFMISLLPDANKTKLTKSLAVAAEETRVDKQVGGSDSNGGSTTIVSKGSVPSVLGFAVENGAIKQSVNGTTVTLRGNPAGILQAASGIGYLQAYGANNLELTKALQKVSFSVSFDTSRDGTTTLTSATSSGTGQSTSTQQILRANNRELSEWSLRADLVNHRDPRDPMYRDEWERFARDAGGFLNRAIAQAHTTLKNDIPDYGVWNTDLADQMISAKEADIESVLKKKIEDLANLIKPSNSDSEDLKQKKDLLQQQLERIGELYADYLSQRSDILTRVSRGRILALEYINNRPLTGATTSTGKIIFETDKLRPAEFTFNGSYTFYDRHPSDTSTSRTRDFQFSAQLDFPLGKLATTGPLVFSLAGKYERLLKDTQIPATLITSVFTPEGTLITIPSNGGSMLLAKKGDIAIVQAKLVIPVKGSGVKIPVSLTWANRTELVKESHSRASIGVTFDLDSIFAKSTQ